MKKYYFAYGSNLDEMRLRSRVGDVKNLGTHTLHGWRLVYNAGTDRNCYANIVLTNDFKDSVAGVVYEVTLKQLKLLDNFEGAPRFYTRMIENYKGKDLQMYVSINPTYTQQEAKGIIPSKDYLSFVIKGAGANQLKATYDQAVELYKVAGNGRALV